MMLLAFIMTKILTIAEGTKASAARPCGYPLTLREGKWSAEIRAEEDASFQINYILKNSLEFKYDCCVTGPNYWPEIKVHLKTMFEEFSKRAKKSIEDPQCDVLSKLEYKTLKGNLTKLIQQLREKFKNTHHSARSAEIRKETGGDGTVDIEDNTSPITIAKGDKSDSAREPCVHQLRVGNWTAEIRKDDAFLEIKYKLHGLIGFEYTCKGTGHELREQFQTLTEKFSDQLLSEAYHEHNVPLNDRVIQNKDLEKLVRTVWDKVLRMTREKTVQRSKGSRKDKVVHRYNQGTVAEYRKNIQKETAHAEAGMNVCERVAEGFGISSHNFGSGVSSNYNGECGGGVSADFGACSSGGGGNNTIARVFTGNYGGTSTNHSSGGMDGCGGGDDCCAIS